MVQQGDTKVRFSLVVVGVRRLGLLGDGLGILLVERWVMCQVSMKSKD